MAFKGVHRFPKFPCYKLEAPKKQGHKTTLPGLLALRIRSRSN